MNNSDEFIVASTLQLGLLLDRSTGSVRMHLTIPGRMGRNSRTWAAKTPHGLSEGQRRDVLLAVEKAVDEWMTLMGAQLGLPLGL